MKRDSLGVPLEPEEPKIVLIDYYGEEIFEGERFFRDDLGKSVKESNIDSYLEQEGSWLIAGEDV